jgi:2-keto-4-pentenoate hydratase/2-oxohepta-3-ene-1,7-dioic acid hydratase in catechol pathway
MRWVTFNDQNGAERTGRVVDDRVHVLAPGTTLTGLLGDDGELLRTAGEQAERDPVEVVQLGSIQLLAPLPRPSTIRDFYAFEQHVRTARQRRGLEMDPDWYELPVFYFSNPYATVGPDVVVPIAPGSNEMDFELEVAAVVGMPGSNLHPERAERHIAGYTIMNDWSARDVQRREMKLSMGPVKGKDFATSLGPMLVTPDELESARSGQAFDLTMSASVNGRTYSSASLADIHYSFGEMLAYASRGTGCILELSLVHGADAYPWLQPGDVVELQVDRLGALRNTVGPPTPVIPLRERRDD